MRDEKGRFVKGHSGINIPIFEKNVKWKGNEVGYSALHKWVKKMKGSSNKCEICNKSGFKGKRIGWANISGLYKREITDWMRLCASCHFYFDRRVRIFKTNEIFALQGRFR
jgi:hypothetical protein